MSEPHRPDPLAAAARVKDLARDLAGDLAEGYRRSSRYVRLRGAIVVGSLAIPSAFLFASIAVILPLFGGISVYGGASVLGVPFALALLGRNQVIVLSALSLIGAMGSYIPPVAFTPVVTAGLIGEQYLPIVRRCLGPAIAAVILGTLVLIYANPIARLFGV